MTGASLTKSPTLGKFLVLYFFVYINLTSVIIFLILNYSSFVCFALDCYLSILYAAYFFALSIFLVIKLVEGGFCICPFAYMTLLLMFFFSCGEAFVTVQY